MEGQTYVDLMHENRKKLTRKLLEMIDSDPDIPERVVLALFRYRNGVKRTTSYEYLEDLLDSSLVIRTEVGSTITLRTAKSRRVLAQEQPSQLQLPSEQEATVEQRVSK